LYPGEVVDVDLSIWGDSRAFLLMPAGRASKTTPRPSLGRLLIRVEKYEFVLGPSEVPEIFLPHFAHILAPTFRRRKVGKFLSP